MKILNIDPRNPNEEYLKEAALCIASGRLAIIPTETVYGIAANAGNKKAIERLCKIKNRPANKPFSYHICDKQEVDKIADDVPVGAYKLIHSFWPGPLTLILKALADDSVGIRMPDDKTALKIISLSRVSVACSSANISGMPAPTDFPSAIKDLQEQVDCALDAGPTRLQAESTIVDFRQADFKVLREGPVSQSDIVKSLSRKTILFICTGNSCRSVMAEGYLRKKMEDSGRNDVEVISAGIMGWGGYPASPETIAVLAGDGIDVSSHKSSNVSWEALSRSDIILVMEKLHEQAVLKINPRLRKRLFLLKEFARASGNDLDIPDPMGRSMDYYRETFAVIKESIDKITGLL